MSPAVAEELSVQGVSTGVVAAEIEDGSVAQRLNLQKGDVIISINDKKIATTRDLEQVTSAKTYYWKITVDAAGRCSRR